MVTYLPVLHAGFIWDDDDHVTANPCIIGPLGLKELWTTSNARYYPLVLTTFWFEHALWGLRPFGYHLVNVLLHAANALVLWRVLFILGVPGSWLGAALWALHPVEVESVAWISEMKNTQSTLFYLLSIFFFVRWLKAEKRLSRGMGDFNCILTLVFAAMAMTSKSSTVVLPLVLCLSAWWVEGKSHWRTLLALGPVLVMSMAAAVLAMWSVELYGDPHNPLWRQSAPERLITAGNVVIFYLGKLLWPHPLVFIYPRWIIDAGNGLSYLPALLVMLVLLFLWSKSKTWARPTFFALAYFLAALLPVLGLVNHFFLRYSFVADHLQYLASMGPLALAGAGLVRMADLTFARQTWMRFSLGGALLLTLGVVSWQRAWAYESAQILWTDTLAKNPGSWMVHLNLGLVLQKKGQNTEALAEFRKALALSPNLAQIHNVTGDVLSRLGRMDEANAEFHKALAIDPAFDEAHYNLANLLLHEGKTDAAIAEYQLAIKERPSYPGAHLNLGVALWATGRQDEAMEQYQQTLTLNPNQPMARINLGSAFLAKGRVDDAVDQFQQAVAIAPDMTEAHTALGTALLVKGEIDEAIAQLQAALQLQPGNTTAQKLLRDAEARAGTAAPK